MGMNTKPTICGISNIRRNESFTRVSGRVYEASLVPEVGHADRRQADGIYYSISS